MTVHSPAGELDAELARRRVIVCCGSGGVGKTTTAAVLAIHAAKQGRRAVVVTIDPARRLADALGLDRLTNSPGVVEGDWPGELSAMMLDTEATFNDLVAKYAGSADQAEKIMANRFYRNIAGALSGTQEYMASEKLYELYEETDFDLIVVDTPPTRNALDFLEAPNRLTRFLDHRLYRVITAPTRGLVKAVNFAAQGFLRTIGKVVGGDVVADAIAFFAAFEGMDAGFRDRAARVDALLGAQDVGFVLVTTPRGDAVEEATFFAAKLASSGISIRALLVNRTHPRFDTDALSDRQLGRLRELTEEVEGGDALLDHLDCLADLRSLSGAERLHLSEITRRTSPAPVCEVPILPFEVHDLKTLEGFHAALFEG